MKPDIRDHIAWMQRRDAEYYVRARAGHDPTDLLAAKAQIQREARKASAETRERIIRLIDEDA